MTAFELTDDQRSFQQTMRMFCQGKIAPRAADTDHRDEFSWDNFHDCVSAGLTSLWVPQEYGGQGADHVIQALMIEEIARASATTSMMMMTSKTAMLPLLLAGTPDQLARYLPPIAAGTSQGSFCLSEVESGSDPNSMLMRAERVGSEYTLRGSKAWITNAGISDVYTVFARVMDAGRDCGVTAFVVERDWGVEVGRPADKMGLRGSPTAIAHFDGVRVPIANRVGAEGQGLKIALASLDRSRPTMAAQAVGLCQAAVDLAAEYMLVRKSFGKPIAEHQGLQFMLADMVAATEAARLLTYRACALIDGGGASALTRFSSIAKCFATDTAMQVTTDCVQVLGAYGYTREGTAERLMRDAKITQIYEGTNQIQRMIISRSELARAR